MNPELKVKREIARFWSNVKKGGPGDCWEYVGPEPNWCGQKQVWFGDTNHLVHRIALELHLGRPLKSPGRNLKGKVVCHRCDNPACVNPDHLYLGTQKSNMEDRSNRGRTSIGVHRYNSKLTEAAVEDIRASYKKYSTTYGIPALARKYKVGVDTVYNVVNNITWKHVRKNDT